MNVELINHTRDAVETLIYTKSTRLQAGTSIEQIRNWSEQEKMDHLNYMKDTIQSSWEFIDYTFKVSGVTRAFTHQFVRTRQGSYAQESQRTIDASNHPVINTINPDENPSGYEMYENRALDVMESYTELMDSGIPAQDARGLLPTNIETSIIAKFDLRTIHNMALLRLCTRTQGEYQKVFKLMLAEILKVHPWAKDWIKVHCAWYGTCAFPNYDACPVQQYTMDRKGQERIAIQHIWEQTEHEAIPIAKDGRTM